jgi:hypothetical protein
MGVAKVESTTVNGAPMEPTSSRSARASDGFAGVSAITNMVRGVVAARVKAPGSVASTKVTEMPMRWTGPARKASEPPYSCC